MSFAMLFDIMFGRKQQQPRHGRPNRETAVCSLATPKLPTSGSPARLLLAVILNYPEGEMFLIKETKMLRDGL
jgi:hypothetical protein